MLDGEKVGMTGKELMGFKIVSIRQKYWSSYVVDTYHEKEMMIMMKTMRKKKSVIIVVMKKSKT